MWRIKQIWVTIILLVAAGFVVGITSVSNEEDPKSNVRSLQTLPASPEPMVQSSTTISYKTISSTRMSLDHNRLIVLVSTLPENFVREKMLVLAQELNEDFASEQRVTAVLFDGVKSAPCPQPAESASIPPSIL